jgi:hypothetical protein
MFVSMCFLDKGRGKEKQSLSILDVGVAQALIEVHFDKAPFFKRGGEYAWSRENDTEGCGAETSKELEW